ncbi:unnamed protein product [Bursaphelenchus okinawaensis]|uniref:Uncharacterized protein n=1 Tax=Bursaphelenchus okinawaensis TaxID=465554 RepID=A0A811LRD4_9BILA|nr:unnamed protein product [Bursaphelenchus okinawaensis]CAG9128132.1 unnamed protein product [Bursaphelenchus okinawaensis]
MVDKKESDELMKAVDTELLEAAVDNGDWYVTDSFRQLGKYAFKGLCGSLILVLFIALLIGSLRYFGGEQHQEPSLKRLYFNQVTMFLYTIKVSFLPGGDYLAFKRILGGYITKRFENFLELSRMVVEAIDKQDASNLTRNYDKIIKGAEFYIGPMFFSLAIAASRIPLSIFYTYALSDVFCTSRLGALFLAFFSFTIGILPLGLVDVVNLINAVTFNDTYLSFVITFVCIMMSTYGRIIYGGVMGIKWKLIEQNIFEPLAIYSPKTRHYQNLAKDFMKNLRDQHDSKSFWRYRPLDEVPVPVLFSYAVVGISLLVLIPVVFRKLAKERLLEQREEKEAEKRRIAREREAERWAEKGEQIREALKKEAAQELTKKADESHA